MNDLFGGDLLVAEVHFPDGTRQGFHNWNRFSSELEVDLIRSSSHSASVCRRPTWSSAQRGHLLDAPSSTSSFASACLER